VVVSIDDFIESSGVTEGLCGVSDERSGRPPATGEMRGVFDTRVKAVRFR
jgi:hypothetical protein